jgi:hypothetical protein
MVKFLRCRSRQDRPALFVVQVQEEARAPCELSEAIVASSHLIVALEGDSHHHATP